MQTCPKCGHPISAGDVFCQNCGYSLTNLSTGTAAQGEASNGAPNPARKTKKKSHKGIVIGSVIGVVVVGLGVFYFVGQAQNSKTKQVNTMISEVNQQDRAKLSQLMSTSDPSLSLNEQTVKPFVDYVQKDKSYLASMSSQLKDAGQTSDGAFKLVTSGHKMFFFPQYKLQVTAMYPTLKTDTKGNTLTVNGKQVATASSSKYQYKAGPLVPGTYSFAAKNGKTAIATSTKDLLSSKDASPTISLTKPAAKTSTPTKTDSPDNKTTMATPNEDKDSSSKKGQVGYFEEEFHGEQQSAIDSVASAFDFEYDDYTYTVNLAHDDVYEVKAYDKDTHDYWQTYRYDQVHDIAAKLNPDTGKFETND